MNNYKLQQFMYYFISNHGYKRIILDKLVSKEEILLINKDNPSYQLIRITDQSLESNTYKKENLDSVKTIISKLFKIDDIKLLNIHVSREEITPIDYDCICIETNYYSGTDLSNLYPLLKNVVHDVENPSLEIDFINKSLNDLNKAQLKNKINKRNWVMISMYVIATICLIIQVLNSYLNYQGYDSNAILILLGANYKTFTIGLNEYWRLFTAGFLHINIFHLLINMYSFYFISLSLKNKLNVFQFLGILFTSIILGNLISVVFNDTTISAGISGGLYGLFIYYFMDLYKNGRFMNNYRSLILSLLPLILINFMSGVDIYAHFGGVLAGLLFYFIFNSKGVFQYSYICLLVMIFIVLIYFMINTTSITFYSGTDYYVVSLLSDYNKTSGNNLLQRLMEVYVKYGY